MVASQRDLIYFIVCLSKLIDRYFTSMPTKLSLRGVLINSSLSVFFTVIGTLTFYLALIDTEMFHNKVWCTLFITHRYLRSCYLATDLTLHTLPIILLLHWIRKYSTQIDLVSLYSTRSKPRPTLFCLQISRCTIMKH